MSDKPRHIEHFEKSFGLIAIKKEFIFAKVLVLILCVVVLLSTHGESRAESSTATGNGAAAAHLNFRIHIPATLYLQIGTLDRKQDTTQFELNYTKEANTVAKYKKSFEIKALGRLSKKGAMFLSSSDSSLKNEENIPFKQDNEILLNAGENNLKKVFRNETLFYTLSSP